MVDLTYLCFGFFCVSEWPIRCMMGNAMSCLSGEERQFTGEGPRRKLYTFPICSRLAGFFFSFLFFLRLVKKKIFSLSLFILFLSVSLFLLPLLLAVARAAVPQYPSLPNYHPHRQTHRLLMALWSWGEPIQRWTWCAASRRVVGSDRAGTGPVFPSFSSSLFASVCLFINSVICSFIYSAPETPACLFWLQISILQPGAPRNKQSKLLFLFLFIFLSGTAGRKKNCNRIMK